MVFINSAPRSTASAISESPLKVFLARANASIPSPYFLGSNFSTAANKTFLSCISSPGSPLFINSLISLSIALFICSIAFKSNPVTFPLESTCMFIAISLSPPNRALSDTPVCNSLAPEIYFFNRGEFIKSKISLSSITTLLRLAASYNSFALVFLTSKISSLKSAKFLSVNLVCSCRRTRSLAALSGGNFFVNVRAASSLCLACDNPNLPRSSSIVARVAGTPIPRC